MTKPIPGIKIPFWKAEQYPVVEGTRCVEIRIPDHDDFMPLLGGLVRLAARHFNYEGADYEKRLALAQMWKDAYDETDWEQCMNCEELLACLQPAFDALADQITAQQTTINNLSSQVTEIVNNIGANGAKQIELPAVPSRNYAYNGALELVREMDKMNRKLYAEAEASLVDNSAEWIATILDVFPFLAAQGVDSGASLANAYFENQVVNYEADYPDFEAPAAFHLMCYIEANDGKLTWDVWGDWLDDLPGLVGSSAPSEVYAKYSPLRQTFLNQVAEIVNQENSLQSYYDNLFNVYYTGSLEASTPPALICATDKAQVVGIIGECGAGVKSSIAFTDGVPFELVAYEDPSFPGSFILPLRLPVGNWDVTLNSITGSITPPTDLNQGAYAWIDSGGTFHQVAWNTPATPEDFGTHDTTTGIYAPWCATQDWNACLFNEAAFTANFTVTAI